MVMIRNVTVATIEDKAPDLKRTVRRHKPLPQIRSHEVIAAAVPGRMAPFFLLVEACDGFFEVCSDSLKTAMLLLVAVVRGRREISMPCIIL